MDTINANILVKEVDKIVRLYGLYFKFLLIGPVSLKKSEIKELLKSKLIKSADVGESLLTGYLNSHFDQLKGSSRKAVRQYALNHIKQRAGMYVDKWVEKSTTDINSIVLSRVNDYNKLMHNTIREELPKTITEGRMKSEIVTAIRDKTNDLAKDWERIVDTELAEAHNLGALDAIIENNKSKSKDEIYVYKTGPKPEGHEGGNKVCKWCSKFWFMDDGATPRVYKLSELLANGSNMGKKSQDWLPTVSVTHPRERHLLVELPNNWGFDDNGNLRFKSFGYNEYDRQRGK